MTPLRGCASWVVLENAVLTDENRSHAHQRVENTSVGAALACRIHPNSDKRVKWRPFLPPVTFLPRTVYRSSSHPLRGGCLTLPPGKIHVAAGV
jgi:hypothetical protein